MKKKEESESEKRAEEKDNKTHKCKIWESEDSRVNDITTYPMIKGIVFYNNDLLSMPVGGEDLIMLPSIYVLFRVKLNVFFMLHYLIIYIYIYINSHLYKHNSTITLSFFIIII